MRSGKTSFVIVDAQSVKNADTAKHKGFDNGKKVSGIKRHIAVDTQGLPHAIGVTTADINDRTGALHAIVKHREYLSEVVNVLADGGYTGQPFYVAVQALLDASVEVVKRSEQHSDLLISTACAITKRTTVFFRNKK